MLFRSNLIPHNPAAPLPYQPSPATRVEMFKSILEAKGVRTFVRRPRGRDIFAACGQLAAVTQTVGLRGVTTEILDRQTA